MPDAMWGELGWLRRSLRSFQTPLSVVMMPQVSRPWWAVIKTPPITCIASGRRQCKLEP